MIEPFLKWPGGKRWLIAKHSSFLPSRFGKYIEPFLGSAAVFFHLEPSSSLLSDSNEELINCYNCLAEMPDVMAKTLASFQERHSANFYYKIRGEQPVSEIARAARFLYLNRTCFNGMYRVNMKGEFNVPIGTKQAVAFDTKYLRSVAKRLKKATIVTADFETSIDQGCAGDFIFVDPPYTVMHNNNGFIKYNAKIFSWKDQIRLSVAVKRAAARGAHIVLTNADHSDVRRLYRGFGHHHQIARASVLSGTASGRRSTTELVVTNYGHFRTSSMGVVVPSQQNREWPRTPDCARYQMTSGAERESSS